MNVSDGAPLLAGSPLFRAVKLLAGMNQSSELTQRVVACFKSLASGDAIGKQTEMLSHAEVQHWYPEGICGFHGHPGDVIPRYRGNRKHEWRIGETTDDTEQTLAVARSLLSAQEVSHTGFGRELLKCRKSLHPGVQSLWTFHQCGDPSRTASDGDGCGAAMRVSPVGVRYSPNRLEYLVRAARESSIPTHGGQLAICAAAAVAGAVSAALEGWPAGDVLKLAIQAAQEAEEFTSPLKGDGTSTIADAISKMHDDLSAHDTLLASELADKYFPDKPETKVPLAINLAILTGSSQRTILLAANVGGDSDSVASIGAAIAGALHPDTVNDAWFDVVRFINHDDLVDVAEALARFRC
jgi:ADP-ribosylglycohydrolase